MIWKWWGWCIAAATAAAFSAAAADHDDDHDDEDLGVMGDPSQLLRFVTVPGIDVYIHTLCK